MEEDWRTQVSRSARYPRLAHQDHSTQEARLVQEKAQCEGHFFHQRYYLKNLDGGCVRKHILNHAFKFHEDIMVNESKIIILLRQVWVYVRKKREF